MFTQRQDLVLNPALACCAACSCCRRKQQVAEDDKHPELVRLYSFAVAVAGLKRFHAARSAAITAGFPAKTAAFLRAVLDGPHAPESIYSRDPFEHIKALSSAIEGLYLVALTTKQGDYNLLAGSEGAAASNGDSNPAGSQEDPAAMIAAALAAGATLDSSRRSMEGLSVLQEVCAGPLLSRAVEKLWALLQDRHSFVYTPPAALAAAKAAAAETMAESNGDSKQKKEGGDGKKEEEEEETPEQKRMRAAAEEAIAMSQVTFDENWHMFLKAVYDTELVPIYTGVGMQLAAGLLQLLAADKQVC